MQHSVGTDEERSAALLVAAAEALLTAQNPSVPSDFISGLFGRVAPEDLIRYDGREIAALDRIRLERSWPNALPASRNCASRRPPAPASNCATPR